MANFIVCKEEENGGASFKSEEVIRDYFVGADYPVIYNFPYGHGKRKASMPVGAQAVLDTSNGWLKLKNIFA